MRKMSEGVVLVLVVGAAWGWLHVERDLGPSAPPPAVQSITKTDDDADWYPTVEACREFTDAIETQLCEHDNTPYRRILREEQRYGPYVARIYTSLRMIDQHPDSRLEIRRGGRLVFTYEDYRLRFVDAIPMGTRVTGRGIPELAIDTHYGTWAQSCVLLEFGATVKRVPLPHHTSISQFARTPDGKCQYRIQDNTFGLYNCCHAADGPMQMWVAFEFHNGRYRFSDRLMRERPPAHARLAAWAYEIRSLKGDVDNSRNPTYIGHILELIYGGNGRLVDEFSRMAWITRGSTTREDFLRGVMSNLRKSPYWCDLIRLNDGHLQNVCQD